MNTIFLVACAGMKLGHKAPACEIYQSTLFNKSKAYALIKADRWYILSAEHGLLAPSTHIMPYDCTLNRMPIAQRKKWSKGVLTALLKASEPTDTIVILAGNKYREFIIPYLEQRGNTVITPLKGKGIGQQLAWLNEQLSKPL